MNKKLIKIFIILVVAIVGLLFAFNMSYGWLYVKFDGKTYVANTGGGTDYSVGEQLGCVQSKIPTAIKPYKNNQSNGFSYGTEIYSSDEATTILIKFDNQYYKLQDINRAEGWGNGIKVKIRENKIVLQ